MPWDHRAEFDRVRQVRNRHKNERKLNRQNTNTRHIRVPSVVFESGWADLDYVESRVKVFESRNRANPTKAEADMIAFLDSHKGGVLKGRYKFQHAISGRWIVDFFFPEVRLAIELDGSIHNKPEQRARDRLKERECRLLDITLVRIGNSEVNGSRVAMVERLRDAWKRAKDRHNYWIGRPAGEVIRKKGLMPR